MTISTPTNSTNSLVHVSNVDKVYASGTHALEDVHLDVHPGEFVSLLGPSGCGKSTLLRIIAGLGEASSGEVLVEGQTPNSPKQLPLGFVFQDANLLPWRSVLGNVMLPLELMGVRKQERAARAREVLELVGLGGFTKAYPKELSGGMRMRVSIARALVTSPHLLLMDEPFGALDEITRQRLNQELLRIKEATGATVVFVTHNVFEAVYLSDRIAVMSAQPGRIVETISIDTNQARDASFRGSEVFSNTVVRVVAALGEGALGESVMGESVMGESVMGEGTSGETTQTHSPKQEVAA
ncbi:MAG: ABC transporter ATP-binding protein [Deinococcota bacterium]